MRRYKDVLVGKSSDLAKAIEGGNKKEAEKVYSETTNRYKARYSEDDRAWFAERSKY